MLLFPFSTSESLEACPKSKRRGSSECWPMLVPEYAFESASCLCCATLWQACPAVFWARGLDRWGLYLMWHCNLHSDFGTALFPRPLGTEEHNTNFSDKSQFVIWPQPLPVFRRRRQSALQHSDSTSSSFSKLIKEAQTRNYCLISKSKLIKCMECVLEGF